MVFDVEDINHWVMFLARNGIQEFTLMNKQATPLKLPTHLFSCLELKHLKLSNCCLQPPPSFCGFPNLLSLDFCLVRSRDYRYGKFIARCTLLEVLKIIDIQPRCEMKPIEIAELKNIKALTLSLCLLDKIAMIRCSSVFQHMRLLPKLQHLHLHFEKCKLLAEANDQMRVCTTFSCLKSLILDKIDFSSDAMLSLASRMIFGSPNLRNVHVTATYENKTAFTPVALCFLVLHCSRTRQLQLQTIVLEFIRGSEIEVCLIKSILACSPMLQKIVIRSLMLDGGNESLNSLASC